VLTLILSALAALLAWLTYREGYRRGCGATARAMGNPKAMTLTEQYKRGWTMGRLDMRQVAESALEEFPTSIGGRAIVRALGGTVPPITRKRAEPDTDTDAGRPWEEVRRDLGLDAGEGAES